MAHITTQRGISRSTGALSKKKDSERLTITRVKHQHDPITGEVVAEGPNEMFLQDRRNFLTAPLTDGERAQRARWSQACTDALPIIRDRSHPRYMEFYHRWRAQLDSLDAIKQFPNFVRAELARGG